MTRRGVAHLRVYPQRGAVWGDGTHDCLTIPTAYDAPHTPSPLGVFGGHRQCPLRARPGHGNREASAGTAGFSLTGCLPG